MRKFKRLSIPQKAHPLVRSLFETMNKEQLGLKDLAERVGLSVNTIKCWRVKNNPRIGDLQACFNALGHDIVVRRSASN